MTAGNATRRAAVAERMVIRDDISLTSFKDNIDGPNMVVSITFTAFSGSTLGYSRSMPPEEFGRWTHSLAHTIGFIGSRVRLRIESGLITGIGHAFDDRWFDPRAAHEISATASQTRTAASALRFINAHRAKIGQAPLDPLAPVWGAAPWTDDDIMAEARALGWRPDR